MNVGHMIHKRPNGVSDQNPGWLGNLLPWIIWHLIPHFGHFHDIRLMPTFRSGSSLLGFTSFCYSIVTPPPAVGACYVGPLESPNVRHQNPGWLGYIDLYRR